MIETIVYIGLACTMFSLSLLLLLMAVCVILYTKDEFL